MQKIKFKIFYNGVINKDNWECFSWTCHLGSETFEYYTGLGHCTKTIGYMGIKPKNLRKSVIRSELKGESILIHIPRVRDLLYALVLDIPDETFSDWCSNFGYDTDSRKALDTYLKCQDNADKLRKVFGRKYSDYVERIRSWEL